jgi:hypothetical protein
MYNIAVRWLYDSVCSGENYRNKNKEEEEEEKKKKVEHTARMRETRNPYNILAWIIVGTTCEVF